MPEEKKQVEEKKLPAERYFQVYRGRFEMILNNFLGGIAWAIGVLFGTGLVIALVSFIISKIDLVPIIGNWVVQIADFVQQNQTKIAK